MQKGLTAKGYQVVAEAPSPTDATLTWNCDVDVKYGNRAMRYFVGFGAGSGHVNSTITAEDRVKETKYRSGADSDLAMGGLGGDIGAVLDANLDKLIGALPEPTR